MTTKTEAPELRAMRTLVDKYSKQFIKMVEAERLADQAGGSKPGPKPKAAAGKATRTPRETQGDGPVKDYDGKVITDSNGEPITRGATIVLKDGVKATVVRLDRRTRRAVATRADNDQLVAAVAHGVTLAKKTGRPAKAAAKKAPAKATK